MATKVKDSKILPAWQRSVSFATSSSDFVQDDVLDFYNSLGRPASEVTIVTAAGASITYALNDIVVKYPINPNSDPRVGYPDLSDPRTFVDPNVPTTTVAASTTSTLTGPIKTLRVTALTVGSGVTIKAK